MSKKVNEITNWTTDELREKVAYDKSRVGVLSWIPFLLMVVVLVFCGMTVSNAAIANPGSNAGNGLESYDTGVRGLFGAPVVVIPESESDEDEEGLGDREVTDYPISLLVDGHAASSAVSVPQGSSFLVRCEFSVPKLVAYYGAEDGDFEISVDVGGNDIRPGELKGDINSAVLELDGVPVLSSCYHVNNTVGNKYVVDFDENGLRDMDGKKLEVAPDSAVSFSMPFTYTDKRSHLDEFDVSGSVVMSGCRQKKSEAYDVRGGSTVKVSVDYVGANSNKAESVNANEAANKE